MTRIRHFVTPRSPEQAPRERAGRRTAQAAPPGTPSSSHFEPGLPQRPRRRRGRTGALWRRAEPDGTTSTMRPRAKGVWVPGKPARSRTTGPTMPHAAWRLRSGPDLNPGTEENGGAGLSAGEMKM